jgi:NAD(P)-dependent dehydrogenase (short-subunit alcohol dehydrogenase family)
VNNAGIWKRAPIVEMTAADIDETLRTNLAGVFNVTREAVKDMLSREWGRVINVSSTAGIRGEPFHCHYAATKGALDTMTIGLAKEVAGEGIRVNAVRPGIIDTDIHAGRPPGQLEKMKTMIPLQRIGTVDEIAGAIMWLASDEASYVTGAFIDARGGL